MCDLCEAMFTLWRNLSRHHQTVHTTTMFHCDSCDVRCSRKDNLLRLRGENTSANSLLTLYVTSTVKDRVEPLSNVPAEGQSRTEAASLDQWFEDIF